MSKTNLMGLSKSELTEFVDSLGWEKYRGAQLFRWIYQNDSRDFKNMTDFTKQNREILGRKAKIGSLKLTEFKSSTDGTIKFLFGLEDNYAIESVLIPEKRRVTLCVSSQAGCALGCKFCATGSMGFKRNLDSGEIVDQFILSQEISGMKITNIVFMGMGEPTLNLKSVLKACDIFTDDHGPSLSQKKITVSTVGVTHSLRKFINSVHKLGLAISLHSADEQIRQKIIPLAGKNPLIEILDLAKQYTVKSGRRISFEYLLIDGVTDRISDAKKLVKAIDGIPCKINLIRYNPVDGLPYESPDEKNVLKFKEYLYPRTYAVMIRESRGLDISGACGQLAVLAGD